MPQRKRKPIKQALVVSVPEAGAMLGLSREGSYAAAKRGEIPVLRIGGLLKVPMVLFEKLLAGEWTPASEGE